MSKPIPEEFSKIMRDFINDIKTTFPEVAPLTAKWWKEESDFVYIDNLEERNEKFVKSRKDSMNFLFKFVQKKLPPRFFDILYENKEIFDEDSSVDTEFLPHIHFKNLWHFDISEKTRETMWKYLQLMQFSIVGSLENKESFGADSEKLFDAFNQEEFKTKLEDAFGKMQEMFDVSGNNTSDINMENIPNPNDVHEKISGMLDGKLGKLAKEIAEETAANFNMNENSSMQDVFGNMFKNPSQLMNLVKNVGDKLDSRIKSGEIKESELIAEVTQLMGQMKNVPGMDIEGMLSKMGAGLGKKSPQGNPKQNKDLNTAHNKDLNTAHNKPLTDSEIEALFSVDNKKKKKGKK